MNEHHVELVLPNQQTIMVHSSGDGKPLVLLHGFPLDATLWKSCVGDLVDGGFHVICPDLRGFGKSGSAQEPVSIVDLASDIEHVRRVIVGDQPIALVGLSLGGYVALEYWKNFGTNLSKLVLTNTKPQADNEAARQNRLNMAQKALDESTWPAVSPMLEKLLSPKVLEENGVITQLVKDMMTRVPPKTVAAIQKAMAQRADFTEQLSQIMVPTLVITGQHDPISPPEENKQWSARLPHGRMVVIAEAAHLPPLEAPEEFTSVLLKFLD